MVLGHGFESQLHLKLDGNDGPLDGRKKLIKIIYVDSQMWQVTSKTFFLRRRRKTFFHAHAKVF
jgi:hypothetical protein